ncbi:hypothetical protein [Methylobacterium fujisawaense]
MPRQITDSRFRLAEHQRQAYRATLEKGTKLKEIRDPDFWRLLSARVQSGDTIEATWEDGSGFAMLYVRAIPGAGRLVVELLFGGLFDDAEDAIDLPALPGAGLPDVQDGVRVEYAGQHELWRVVLESDGRVIKSGLGMQREARRQRTVYLQTLGRTAA